MGKLKPFGLLLGLAGNALIGLALYHLIQTGSCGGYGMPACPDSITPWVLSLPVGIMVSVVSIFLGGGAWVFSGVFLAVGLGSMSASAFGDTADTEVFGWVFGGAFTFFGLVPLVLYIASKPALERRVKTMSDLVATGAKGVGTVTAVRDTGVTINDDPRVEISMRIEPVDGSSAFSRTKTVVVSRVAIPRAGDRFPVWYDRKDSKLWGYGVDIEPSAPPEVQDLFDRATAPDPVPVASAPVDTVGQLTKLNDLRLTGALTDEEFTAAKDRLLGVTP